MNKKQKLLPFILLFNLSLLFSNSYRITDTEYNITGAGFRFLGKTKSYSIERNYPLDKQTIFESEEALKDYISNYQTQLLSSRFFESCEITYETSFYNQSDDVEDVILRFEIQDSHHLLFVPYGKYTSNDGLKLKLKARDSNFLGSMNTLSSELNLSLSNKGISPGFTFSYDLPFKMGDFDAQLVNDYEISYTSGYSMPEWNAKTGLKLTKALNQDISFVIEGYQYFIKNFDYQDYGDDMYFNEEAALSLPVSLYNFDNFTKLIYTPKLSFNYYWDFDGIDILNDDLSSPALTFSQNLSNEKIVWEDFFRNGYSFSLTNSYMYNIQRNDFSPYLGFEAKLFYSFVTSEKRSILEQFGISTDIYVFSYMYWPDNSFFYGEKIGSRLRGILDDSYLGNSKPEYTTSTAFVANIDLPHHLFTTNFKHELFNFSVQASPFLDIALILDRENKEMFSLKNGCYCAGLELLINPLKWSSYTIRCSLGFDLQGVRKSDSIIEGLKSCNEIFIGIGLQY